MKTIKIAHLYYDLMNLYGEVGNILALVKHFELQNVKADVTNLTVGDKIDFQKYDIFYMGMGTEDNLEIVRKDILKYKNDIEKVIKDKTFIMTGNSFELFGKKIDKQKCLEIFNYSSSPVYPRFASEVDFETKMFDKKIIGFQNRGSSVNNAKNYLFENEGYHENNFYGTYTLGPLLIRNPFLTDKIVKDILDKKGIDYKEITDTPDYQAYYEYIKNFEI